MQNIIVCKPIYKEKIWGGRKLETSLQREIPKGKIGESWEISDYGKEISIIQNGEWAGLSFREVYKKFPIEVLGDVFSETDDFPLLVKIIDSEDRLSVQVHPDDEYSRTKDPENKGKKESWFILHAEEKAEIVCGFNRDLDRSEYERLVISNQAESPLQTISVKSGDAFIINPGTVHAIGAGCLILEIQQSSDSTYRVYDYGRLGDDGKPRELHLQKALDVLYFGKSTGKEFLCAKEITNTNRKLLVSNDKFRIELAEILGKENFPKMTKTPVFHIGHVIRGELEIDEMYFQKGQTFLVTAKGIREDLKIQSKNGCSLAIACAGTDWVEF